MRDLIKKVLTENLPKKGMVLKENVEASKGLMYMVENKIPLTEVGGASDLSSLILDLREGWY